MRVKRTLLIGLLFVFWVPSVEGQTNLERVQSLTYFERDKFKPRSKLLKTVILFTHQGRYVRKMPSPGVRLDRTNTFVMAVSYNLDELQALEGMEASEKGSDEYLKHVREFISATKESSLFRGYSSSDAQKKVFMRRKIMDELEKSGAIRDLETLMSRVKSRGTCDITWKPLPKYDFEMNSMTFQVGPKNECSYKMNMSEDKAQEIVLKTSVFVELSFGDDQLRRYYLYDDHIKNQPFVNFTTAQCQ